MVFELIRSRRLQERYALLWLRTGVVILVLAVWRERLGPDRRPGRDRLSAVGALHPRLVLHPRRPAPLLDRDLEAVDENLTRAADRAARESPGRVFRAPARRLVTEQASLALRPWQVRLRAAFDAPLAAPLAVGALMLTAFIARVLLSRDVLAPWAMLDELQYAEAARSFISGGHYLFRDEHRPLRTIYPVLIFLRPGWRARSRPRT